MRKFLLGILLAISLTCFVSVYAAPGVTAVGGKVCFDKAGNKIPCGAGLVVPDKDLVKDTKIPTTPFKENVMTIVNYFLGFLALAGVVAIVWAGVLLVASPFEDKSADKAKDIIKYVIIGFVIIILSYSIVRILTEIGGPSSGSSGTSTDSSGSSEESTSQLPNGDIVPNYLIKEVLSDGTVLLQDGTKITKNGDKILPDGTTIPFSDKKMISTISVSPTEGYAPLTITLDGMKSYNPSGQNIANNQFIWSFTDTTGNDKVIGQGPIQSYTFEEDGVYIVRLKVLHGEGNGSLDGNSFVQVVVKPKRADIKININNKDAKSITRLNIKDVSERGVNFDPSATKAQKGRTIEEYTWDFGNGSQESFPTPETILQYYKQAGEYNIKLQVKDNVGEIIEKTFKIIIEPLTAEIEFIPEDGYANQGFEISGEQSKSSDDFIKSYSWSIKDPSGKEAFKSSESRFTFTAKKPGPHSVSLTVENNKKERSNVVKVLNVKSHEPVAVFTANQKNSMNPGIMVFDGGASFDIDNEQLKYSWDFDGDGIYEKIDSSSFKEEFSYKKIGQYTPVLKVKDPYGNESSYRRSIDIVSILNVDFDISRVAIQKGSSIAFTSKASNAESIYWDFGDGKKEASISNRIDHTFSKAGVYTITMTALDSNQKENFIRKNIYVGDGNYPVGAFYIKINGEQTPLLSDLCGEGSDGVVISRNDTVEFDGAYSVNMDNDNKNLSYTWDFGDGSFADGQVARYRYKIPRDECYPASVKVKDILSGKASKVSNTIWIKVVNKKPIIGQILVSPENISVDGAYTTPLKVNVSLPVAKDDDGTLQRYRWWYHAPFSTEKLGFTETFTPNSTLIINAKGQKGAINEYYFTAEIVDNEGLSATNEELYGNSELIKVVNGDTEKFKIDFNVANSRVALNENVIFYPVSTGLSEQAVYQWDFDGDSIIDESTIKNEISHKYDKAGTYNVELRVENKSGVIERAFKKIFMSENINPIFNENPSGSGGSTNSNVPQKSNLVGVDFNSSENSKNVTSSIILKGDGVPATVLNLKALKLASNKFVIQAHILQADSTLFDGNVEFLVKKGKGRIQNSFLKAYRGIAEAIVNIESGDDIEIEAIAKDTVYGELKEVIYLKN